MGPEKFSVPDLPTVTAIFPAGKTAAIEKLQQLDTHLAAKTYHRLELGGFQLPLLV
ncbi:hypothetical protein [Shewanella sp. ECSMB14102]|uniref:hypothetical protein n=1 Tax=Shewanella sp. ECSMB14102 TaxID=1579504 RepID=UPI001F40E4F0|nr:hypothetical protein [Shewanella sp. ECSMB14102]